jgi:hypothetical protein
MNYPTDMFSAELLKFAGIDSEFFLSGPSVSNTCFDILFKMGCNPIILIGQDLSYTELEVEENRPGSPDKEGMVLENDIHGKSVYTNAVFLSMRNWFEGYFEKARERVEIINATEGGLNIRFAENENLSEVIKRLNFKEICLADRIGKVYDNSRFPKYISISFEEYVKLVGHEIEKLEKYCLEQDKIVNLIEKGVYHPKKNRKTFERMVGRVAEITGLVVSSSIYNTLLKNILDIDFYLVKLEVDRATEQLKDYEDVKAIYTKAMRYQSDLLKDKLSKLKTFLRA